MMVVIAGIAVWLGLFRAWPVVAVLLALLSGPTAGFYRWFARETERDEGRPPGLLLRMFLLFAALTIAVITVPAVLFALVLIAGALSKLLSHSL